MKIDPVRMTALQMALSHALPGEPSQSVVRNALEYMRFLTNAPKVSIVDSLASSWSAVALSEATKLKIDGAKRSPTVVMRHTPKPSRKRTAKAKV